MKIEPKINVCARFLYMYSQEAKEINTGLLVFYQLQDSAGIALMLGCDYRNDDALIIHAGIKQDQSIFRFSYDINNSYLNNFSGGRGAWEFSLILTGQLGKPLFAVRIK